MFANDSNFASRARINGIEVSSDLALTAQLQPEDASAGFQCKAWTIISMILEAIQTLSDRSGS